MRHTLPPPTPQAPSLPQRRLGACGPMVSALGFGVSGPHSGAFVSPQATGGLLSQAMSAGITLFDTAPFYGDGEAERRLGTALANAGERAGALLVMTKVGTLAAGPGRWRKDFSAAHIRASVEGSRRRLGCDRLGALLLHGPSPADLTAELLRTLEALVSSGQVGLIGVAGRGAELDAAMNAQAFHLLMAPVHAGLETQAQERLTRAHEAGLGVLGIEALAPAPAPLAWPRRTADLWYLARRIKRRVSGARPPAATMTPGQALAAAFALGLADAIITTTTRASHLSENIALAASLDAAGGVA